MFDLSPVKILVILVVALVVLGPDKLPNLARQIGAAWGQLRRWRERLEEEVRGSFPDLPSAGTLTQAVRSPLSFLERLADEHEATVAPADAPRGEATGHLEVGGGDVGEPDVGERDVGVEQAEISANGAEELSSKGVEALGGIGPVGQGAGVFGASRGPRGFLPPVPDDPTMN